MSPPFYGNNPHDCSVNFLGLGFLKRRCCRFLLFEQNTHTNRTNRMDLHRSWQDRVVYKIIHLPNMKSVPLIPMYENLLNNNGFACAPLA